MGLSFDTPLALLLLHPRPGADVGLHLASRRRLGSGRRRARPGDPDDRPLAALVFALAGFQLVLPVDRLATVFVVDLSDSVGNAGREDALAFLRETLAEQARGRRGRDRRVRRARRSSSDCRPTWPRSIGSHRRRSGRPPTSGPRCAWRRRCSPTMRRSGSCCSPTATTRPAAARRRPPSPPRTGVRIETRRIGPGNVDEVLIERLTTPSTAAPRRIGRGRGRDPFERSPRPRPSGCSPTGRWWRPSRCELEAGITRVTFDVTPTEAGFHTFRAVVEAARDTFSQNDRADSNTIVKGEPRTLVLAGDDTGRGRARRRAQRASARRSTRSSPRRCRPTSPASRRYDSVVLVDVARPAPERPPAGRAPGLRARPRQGPGDDRRARELRRRRLPEDAPRGDAAGRHGRPRPPEAAGHRARRGHRPVGLDGRLPLQHVRSGRRRRRDRRRPQGRHRQGGDPARGGGPDRTRRARRGRLQRGGALGRPDPAARRRSSDLQGQIAGIQPDGQTNIFAGLDQAVQSLEGRHRHAAAHHPADRRLVHLRPVRRDPGPDEGRRHHPLDRRRRRRREPVPRAARPARRRAVLRGQRTPPASRTSSSRRPSRSPASRSSRSRSSRSRPRRRRSCAASTRGSPGFAATTGRRSSRPPRACWSRPATTRSSPSGSTGSDGPWPGPRMRPGAGPSDWVGWPGFNRFFSQLVSWTFPGEETGGIEATFEPTGGETAAPRRERRARRLAARLLLDERGRGRAGSRATNVDLVQVAPGVYEAPLGEIDPGAYAVRITQTEARIVAARADRRAGGSDRRPSTACWGPTSRVLAALRAASGGSVDRHAARPVAPRSQQHGSVHRAVAAAADPRAAAVAAGHRPAPDVARAARAGGGPRLGRRRVAPAQRDGPTDGDRREPAGRP